MFDEDMRTKLVQLLVFIVWSVFDQTCFNRLATHFNISMFGHQTMVDVVWSPNVFRLSRPLLNYFITYGKQDQFNSFKITGLWIAEILLANGNEPNLILPKFARTLYFFLIRLCGISINKYCYKKIVNIFAFSLQLSHRKM